MFLNISVKVASFRPSSGDEADHPVPAGPAQPADHGGPEGLLRPALCVQISAETRPAAAGEYQQVSHFQSYKP